MIRAAAPRSCDAGIRRPYTSPRSRRPAGETSKLARCDLAPWPNVSRWLRNVKALPNWGKVNEPFYQRFVGAFKDAPMEKF